MKRKQGRMAALLLVLCLLLSACSEKESPPLSDDDPLLSGSPASTAKPAVTPPPLSMIDNDIVLTFFPDNAFIRLDDARYSDVIRGDVISIDTALAGGDNNNLVVIKKESNFAALGFITYFVAEMDFAMEKITSDVLAVPQIEPNPDTVVPLPDAEGQCIPFHRNGRFYLLFSTCLTEKDGTENWEAGLWSLQNGNWRQLWPEPAYGTQSYADYWQDRKAEIGEEKIVLYTRNLPPADTEPPSDSPSPEETESPAPTPTPPQWKLGETIMLDSLLG